MNPVLPLLAPIALLLPGVAGIEVAHRFEPGAAPPAFPLSPGDVTPPRAPPEQIEPVVPQSPQRVSEPDRAEQVSIEQRFTIRITPRSAMPAALIADLPETAPGPRWKEKKMGKCLAIGGIAAVQYRDVNKLILYLRDRRIVSATLEKACRAADFYSGFYVARNGDGMLCTGRDALLSRSGANCQLSSLRQLIDADG